MAQEYLQKRADQLTVHGAGAKSVRTSDVAGSLAERAEEDAAALADRGAMYRENDGGNKSARVELSPGKMSTKDGRVALEATEDTRLYYAKVAQGDPAFESFALPHKFEFEKAADGWKLVADQPQSAPGAVGAPTQTGGLSSGSSTGGDSGRPSETQSPGAAAAGPVEPTKLRRAKRKKVVRYAEKYVKKYNRKYRKYDQDCTNFVSQAMRAGGWKHKGSGWWDRKDNDKWYYSGSARTTSHTWVGAEKWGVFARDKSKRTKRLSNVWYMRAADVLQANLDSSGGKDHSMIVVHVSKGGERYLNYHTTDTRHKRLSRVIKEYPHAKWYAHRA